jgi:hypothetical protein
MPGLGIERDWLFAGYLEIELELVLKIFTDASMLMFWA